MHSSLIEAFYDNRDKLIDSLESGAIDKISFFEENLAFFKDQNFRPKATEKLTFDEAVIHYQYYNLMAKWHLMMADDYGMGRQDSDRERLKAGEYYTKKDLVSMQLVALSNYEGIKAYFIQMQSKSMEGELYEVYFTEVSRLILHSKDKRLLNRLKQAGVFDENLQASAIDAYVNTRYK